MMGYGGQGSSDSSNSGVLLNSDCELNSHPLTTHDSGIDLSPHDLDSHGSDSQDLSLIRTQEIEYQDVSSSSETGYASFSDNVSFEEYPKPKKSSVAVDRRTRRRRSPPKATFDFNDNSLVSVYTFFKTFLGASTASTVAIDNKIEQAMDLVKSHLMFAVREEVDVLKDRIVELMDRITHLECENSVLRQYATPEVLQQLQVQLPHQIQQPSHHSSTS